MNIHNLWLYEKNILIYNIIYVNILPHKNPAAGVIVFLIDAALWMINWLLCSLIHEWWISVWLRGNCSRLCSKFVNLTFSFHSWQVTSRPQSETTVGIHILHTLLSNLHKVSSKNKKSSPAKVELQMARYRSQMPITPGNIVAIVNKHSDRISAAQWTLAAGTSDSLADVMQSVSVAVLKTVIPRPEEQKLGSASQTVISTGLKIYNAQLGNSLTHSQFCCRSSRPIWRLAWWEWRYTDKTGGEGGFSHNYILSVIIRSPDWPEDPGVFVSSSVSNIRSLRGMECQATTWRHLGKVNPQKSEIFIYITDDLHIVDLGEVVRWKVE